MSALHRFKGPENSDAVAQVQEKTPVQQKATETVLDQRFQSHDEFLKFFRESELRGGVMDY